MMVVHEDRTGTKQAAAQARVAKEDMWRVILALLIVVIAISTTFNAVTVALPKLFAERLADMTRSPALLGVIAAGVYVFGAMTQYTIGKLLDRYSLKAVTLPLSFMLAPFLYLAATLSNLPLILVSIGIVMGAFGQVTVNDAMVGKYTSEEWRSRAYSVRYFVGFTAAGASVGLVAWLYEQGGFVTMLQAFGGLCLLVIVAAIILPQEIKVPAAQTGCLNFARVNIGRPLARGWRLRSGPQACGLRPTLKNGCIQEPEMRTPDIDAIKICLDSASTLKLAKITASQNVSYDEERHSIAHWRSA